MFGHSRCTAIRSDELMRRTGLRPGWPAGSQTPKWAVPTQTPQAGLKRAVQAGLSAGSKVDQTQTSKAGLPTGSTTSRRHTPEAGLRAGLRDRGGGALCFAHVPPPRPAASSFTSLRKAPLRFDPDASVGFGDRAPPRPTSSVFGDCAPLGPPAAGAGSPAERHPGRAARAARRGRDRTLRAPSAHIAHDPHQTHIAHNPHETHIAHIAHNTHNAHNAHHAHTAHNAHQVQESRK